MTVWPQLSFSQRNVPSERRRAAALDSRHHLQLAEAHVAAIGLTPSGTVVAEDIRNLQSWTGHEGRGLLGRLVLVAVLAQLIERAHDHRQNSSSPTAALRLRLRRDQRRPNRLGQSIIRGALI